MPEKAVSAKRHSPIAQSFESFLKRLRDEPGNAAYFAKKIGPNAADLLKHHRRARDQGFFPRVFFLFSHFQEERGLSNRNRKVISSRWRSRQPRTNCSAPEIYVDAMFCNLHFRRAGGSRSGARVRENEFDEGK